MFGAARPKKPPKLHNNQQSLSQDNFYRTLDLDDIIQNLHANVIQHGIVNQPLSPSSSNSAVSGVSLTIANNVSSPPPNRGIYLRLNVGGTSFRLRNSTIVRRCPKSVLYQMVFRDHEGRCQLADGFLEESSEYFFERSSEVFQLIYNFYVTGVCHKPSSICLDVFVGELTYWNITTAVFAQCCLDHNDNRDSFESKSKFSVIGQLDEFRNLKFGRIRWKIWSFLEVPESSIPATIFSCLSVAAVLISIAIMVAASIPELQIKYERTTSSSSKIENKTISYYYLPHPMLIYSEYCAIGWFTLEYSLKMIVASNRWRTFCQILNIVDLIAIVPFYFELGLQLSGFDTSKLEELNGPLLMMRVLRVSRVIRIFKLGRYSSGLRAFARTLKASQKQLSMLAVVLTTGIMFFSTLVYNLEKDAPGTKFISIPAGFWWCIVTMTTVGYGDMVPETTIGKLAGSGAIACGVLVLALPITIIVDNFMKVHEEDREFDQSHPIIRRQLFHRRTIRNKSRRNRNRAKSTGSQIVNRQLETSLDCD